MVANGFRAAVCAVLLALGMTIGAQESPLADSGTQPATHLLAADTEIHLRLLESVASNTHKHGDRFAFDVVDPVLVDGVVVLPTGAKGEGEVVHAAKAGFGGRAGELILVSRFVRVGDQSVKLRSFSAGTGENRVNLALGLSIVVVGIFVTGKEIVLPAGTDVFAQVANESLLPAAAATGRAAVDSPASSSPQQPSTEIENNESSQPSQP